MHEESAAGEKTGNPAAGVPLGKILCGPWAFGLAGALVLLLAAVEGAHWHALSDQPNSEQVIQQPAPISSPATHPDVAAPDPGDNP